MGINDEYSRDAYLPENTLGLGGDEADTDEPDLLHPEDWQDWHSEELLDLWFSMHNFSEDNFHTLLHRARYPDWVQFVMYPGDWYPSVDQKEHPLISSLWEHVKQSDLLQEFDYVSFQNFVIAYS
jgi:hypothetical protein